MVPVLYSVYNPRAYACTCMSLRPLAAVSATLLNVLRLSTHTISLPGSTNVHFRPSVTSHEHRNSVTSLAYTAPRLSPCPYRFPLCSHLVGWRGRYVIVVTSRIRSAPCRMWRHRAKLSVHLCLVHRLRRGGVGRRCSLGLMSQGPWSWSSLIRETGTFHR